MAATEDADLRSKLLLLGERFIGLDEVVADDSTRRRRLLQSKTGELQLALEKLETAIQDEVSNRVADTKNLLEATQQFTNAQVAKNYRKFDATFTKLEGTVDAMETRIVTLERGISQFRGDLPSKIQVDTAALAKEISELRARFANEKEQVLSYYDVLKDRLNKAESFSNGLVSRFSQETAAEIKKLQDLLESTVEDVKEGMTTSEEWKTRVIDDFVSIRKHIHDAETNRKISDDEIVDTINSYTRALQRILSLNSRSPTSGREATR